MSRVADLVGATLGAPVTIESVSFPEGVNGDSSRKIIETRIPISAFGASLPNMMHFDFVAQSGAVATAVTLKPNGQPIMYPPVTGRRHSVEPPESGGGGPRIITLDGQDGDWNGLAPLVSGAASLRLKEPLEGFVRKPLDLDTLLTVTTHYCGPESLMMGGWESADSPTGQA